MTFIIVVIFLVIVLSMRSQITALEDRVKKLEGETQSTLAPSETPSPTPVQSQPLQSFVTAPVEPQAASYTPDKPPYQQPIEYTPDAFTQWVKEDFFVKLGGLLILLALGWFVSYAFANNWIGEGGRIALGLSVGALFLVAGVWRMKVSVPQGSIFTVIGSTTMLLTVFAAQHLYSMFIPLVALMMMFATVVFVAFVSVRYSRQELAIAGLLMGALAPFLTAASSPELVGVLSYYLVLILGTLWVVYLTGWTSLTPMALLIISFITVPAMLSSRADADTDTLILFGFVYVTVFFVANLFSAIRRVDVSHHPSHLFTAVGTALYVVAIVNNLVSDHMQSLLLTAWALVFGVGSYVVYRYTAHHPTFYIYGGAALALIGVATAAELDGPMLTIAYIIEIGVLLWTAARLKVSDEIMVRLSFLYVIPVALSLASIVSTKWSTGVLHADLFVLVLLTLSLTAVGLSILERYYHSTERSEEMLNLSMTLMVVAGGYAATIVWLVTHALLTYDVASLFSLVLYTVVGLTLYVIGSAKGFKEVRLVGAIILGLVVIRLLMVDVWKMELVSRVITFVVIGVMLLSTALIKRHDGDTLR